MEKGNLGDGKGNKEMCWSGLRAAT